ncbi:MAG: hypothetical protein WCG99_01850 [Candidatus Berkelbacteria bacterium]
MIEDEKVATSAPAPAAPAKKSNATTIIIVVVALVVLGVGGTLISRWVARKAADKITSGILSSVTGSNVSVNSDSGTTSVSNGSGTTSVGGNVKWPADMPTSVPKLTVGTLTMSTSDKSSSGWSVIASDISQVQFDTYKASVVSAGWTNTATTSFGADILTYEKDSNSLMLTYDPTSSGLSVTVTTKSE